MTEEELKKWILADSDFMTVLKIVEAQALPEAWIAAGCLRNFIWNKLSYGTGFDWATDIDLVFFDQQKSYQESMDIENELKLTYPSYQWEVRNQAHMHTNNPGTPPYKSTTDAISKYPETCTAIAIRLIKNELELFIPYGLETLEALECHPTPYFLANPHRLKIYHKRLRTKTWKQKWPKLRFYQN